MVRVTQRIFIAPYQSGDKPNGMASLRVTFKISTKLAIAT